MRLEVFHLKASCKAALAQETFLRVLPDHRASIFAAAFLYDVWGGWVGCLWLAVLH